MRYFEFVLKPDDGTIHPVDTAIAEMSGLTREALVYVNALADGTGLMLYRLRGEANRLPERLDTHPDLLTCALVNDEREGETFYFYVHVESGQPAGRLMALVQKYALMIIPPLAVTEHGLRVRIVGTHEMLTRAIEEIPDEMRVSVEQVGEYSPPDQSDLSVLTDRQRDVLDTAVAEGYYDIPRRATHEDIGDSLDCAPSTVDEHLRKAESRIFTVLLGDESPLEGMAGSARNHERR